MSKTFLLITCIFLGYVLPAQVRSTLDFNGGWKFHLGDDSSAGKQQFNDAAWRTVTLPHDWSIELPFAEKAAATTQGGALPGGIGWYRKTFTVPAKPTNKNIFIEFDGIYRNSEVWINGQFLGKRPNGYTSFRYEVTPYLKPENQQNVIAVKADNSQQPNSRWYTGSGIYRDVRLVTENNIAFDYNGVFVQTFFVSGDLGESACGRNLLPGEVLGVISVSAVLRNNGKGDQQVTLVHDIYDAAGKKVAGSKPYESVLGTSGTRVSQDGGICISKPHLWSTERPYLYKVVSTLLVNNVAVDQITTVTGIRKFSFDREKGFFMNNKPVKIKGVCMHHDLGALGAAFNLAAAKRQLVILKEMGCNAIRTSHNPPAPGFLDLCDQMGFLVMDEAFDMWQKKKNKFDYSMDFRDWYKKDLADMVLRDRNHPSIFMWSIGNEIREQFDSTGIAITRDLVSIVKRHDPGRPVTSALTEIDTLKNYIYQANALDVLGWNYNHVMYPDFLQKYPGQIFLASETNSAIASRGHYDMPSDSVRTWPAKGEKETSSGNADFTVSAYDNAKAYWGSTHEETWKVIKKYEFLSGLFVWTGFDYLGEPTPYPWPARSSYFGIIDLAGFPKDVYYMYQSEWTSKPVLHIFPHWNWEPGKLVDVWAYYNNADEVELFLNGKSLGIQKKKGDDLHVMWRVQYEPGELRAISRKNGIQVLSTIVKTAGKPARIRLLADRTVIKADGKDLSFITVQVLDAQGNLVPDAANLVEFSLNGKGLIAGTDNGSQTSLASFKDNKREAFNGLCLAILQSAKTPGKITLQAKSKGLPAASITITAK